MRKQEKFPKKKNSSVQYVHSSSLSQRILFFHKTFSYSNRSIAIRLYYLVLLTLLLLPTIIANFLLFFSFDSTLKSTFIGCVCLNSSHASFFLFIFKRTSTVVSTKVHLLLYTMLQGVEEWSVNTILLCGLVKSIVIE